MNERGFDFSPDSLILSNSRSPLLQRSSGGGGCSALYRRGASEYLLLFFFIQWDQVGVPEKSSCCQRLEGFEDKLSPETAGNILLAALNSPLLYFNSQSLKKSNEEKIISRMQSCT